MFIVSINYNEGLQLNEHAHLLRAHHMFLLQTFAQAYWLVCGNKVSHTGEILISAVRDMKLLKGLLQKNPLFKQNKAEFYITEFHPDNYQHRFAACLSLRR